MSPFNLIYSFEFILLLACAAFFYKAGDFENESAILWCGLSIVTFLFTWIALQWRIPGNLLGQAALLATITIIRALRDTKGPRS